MQILKKKKKKRKKKTLKIITTQHVYYDPHLCEIIYVSTLMSKERERERERFNSMCIVMECHDNSVR